MAFSSDGNGRRVDFPNSWNPQGQAFSLSVWLYFTTASDSAAYPWHVGETDSSFGMAIMRYDSPGNRFKFARWGTAEGSRRTSTTLTTDTWEHWLVTHDGVMTTCATTMHIYRSGTEASYDSNVNGSGEASYGATNYSIGGRNFDTTRDWGQGIAQMGIWNRVLTAGEIAALSAGYAPNHFPYLMKHYHPMIRPWTDLVTGQQGTPVGTPSVMDNPTNIIYRALPAMAPLESGPPVVASIANLAIVNAKRSAQIPLSNLNL